MEVIIYFLVISLTFILTIEFFMFSNKLYKNIFKGLEGRENIRIATEFLQDKILSSKNIYFNNGILTVDNKKIYLNKDVLIYEYNSTPVVDKINYFNVIDLGRGVYEIHISSGSYVNKVIVKKR
ncbi:hypothetical protein [Caloramator australicus]|nr:hypothetical protein [Caloramator australicus]